MFHDFAVWFRQTERKWLDRTKGIDFSTLRSEFLLQYRSKKHQSVLIRNHFGVDLRLQQNKVHNLNLVIQKLNGILIQPGETFSFWKLVGRPSEKEGYKEGMELQGGVAKAGIGGGICQVSNLVFWLVLHSPLEVTERHHHSFDPFPDEGRVLPFACGATVFWNYRDLRIHNPTSDVFQLLFWMDETCLNADLRCSEESTLSYEIIEKEHRFEQVNGKWRRKNALWRLIKDKQAAGNTHKEEFLFHNDSEVKYIPSEFDLKKRFSTSPKGT